jgi:putative flippase GtrA
MNMRPADSRSAAWFLAVGGVATAMHYVITLSAHRFASLSPAFANLAGFLCAFPVSYLGHRHLSFAGTTAGHGKALSRLFAVSCLSFAGNQALLLLLLKFTLLPLWIALGLVLGCVAVVTYVLSRLWAFAS